MAVLEGDSDEDCNADETAAPPAENTPTHKPAESCVTGYAVEDHTNAAGCLHPRPDRGVSQPHPSDGLLALVLTTYLTHLWLQEVASARHGTALCLREYTMGFNVS
ncbi:unnamed protein product [Pleuronectes platessa]|uniref:Uncharacterized protein n=1 Tax=Pleuronectes platessa TaxID=8262 RepID=A0A9N7TGM7_PLEPL|nr:unnamed protein product [Pleuronectes platessa]